MVFCSLFCPEPTNELMINITDEKISKTSTTFESISWKGFGSQGIAGQNWDTDIRKLDSAFSRRDKFCF